MTKGPSLNPADKRLAVRHEDHPFAYGCFEGTIPKGQYGGGTVMIWDAGTWKPKGDPHAGLKKGHLSFDLHGERLRGGWDLVRLRGDEKRENWLLIKEKDPAASRTARERRLSGRSSSVSRAAVRWRDRRRGGKGSHKHHKLQEARHAQAPMGRGTLTFSWRRWSTQRPKASSGSTRSSWTAIVSWVSLRAAARVCAPVMERIGREGFRRSTLRRDTKCQAAVLDMEAVLVDDEGKEQFSGAPIGARRRRPSREYRAYGFDLLHLDGKDLTRVRLSRAQGSAPALLAQSRPSIALPLQRSIVGNGGEMHTKACETGSKESF